MSRRRVIMKILKNTLVKNTFILILTSMLIRLLGLVNRVILTRMLGNDGISLYMIVLPSIMMFISLGSLSLNITITKITATKNDRSVIKKGIKIGIISSIIVGIILMLIARPLAYNWLKQKDAYFPILLTPPLIILSAINSVLRGYFNGIKKVNIRSLSILIEQIVRIGITVFLLKYFLDRGIVFAVTLAVLAMSFGEIASIIYIIIMLNKWKPHNNQACTSKEILDISLPITGSRLIGNITYFLEPIIFTFALTILQLNNTEIMYKYSEVTAYTLPLITMFSFVSTSVATAIIPHVASASKNEVGFYIKKACFYCLLPAIPISIILTLYGTPLMKLIYDTDIGGRNVERYAIFFLIFYIRAPLTSIMQARNKSKRLLQITAIGDIMRIALIFTLPFLTNDSLIIATLIPLFFIVIFLYYELKKDYPFQFTSHEIINFCLLTIIVVLFAIITKVGNLNYLLASALIILVFILGCNVLSVFRFRNI